MRINSREELLDLADRYDIKRYEDGRIDKIEAYRRGALIHTSQAIYNTSPTGLTRIVDVQGFLFPEIWNSIETPELNWYDRNPTQIILDSSFVSAISPFAVPVELWTYTCPAKRKAFAEVIRTDLAQQVATTDAGEISNTTVYLTALKTGFVGVISRALFVGVKAIGAHEFTQTGQSVTLIEGDILNATRFSSASDGTLLCGAYAKLTEFDA